MFSILQINSRNFQCREAWNIINDHPKQLPDRLIIDFNAKWHDEKPILMFQQYFTGYNANIPSPILSMPPTTQTSVDAKMDEIITCLQRMDKRDRLRTIGGFIRGLLGLIPLIVLLWSLWYFASHGEELMKMIANQAASSAAQYTQGQSQGLVEQLMKQYSIPQK